MKGFKAFGKGLVCKGKQYAENTVFEESEAVICCRGMHFCKNPFDVLDYYPLIDSNGNVAEVAQVEALDECHTDDSKKYCTKKLKIGFKLSLKEFVKAAIDFALEKNDGKVSTGKYAKFASAGEYAQLASAGSGARLASAGYGAQLASAGYEAKLASAGKYAKLASAGDEAQLASAGDGAQLASAGSGARLASAGYGAQLASVGDGAKIASAGEYAKLASAGEYAVIAGIGRCNKAKGKKGSWLVLAEWGYNDIERKYIPICVKAAQIDGAVIKEDTFYKLENGEFKEA